MFRRAERELGMPFNRMTQAPIVDGFVADAARYVSRWETDHIARRASRPGNSALLTD